MSKEKLSKSQPRIDRRQVPMKKSKILTCLEIKLWRFFDAAMLSLRLNGRRRVIYLALSCLAIVALAGTLAAWQKKPAQVYSVAAVHPTRSGKPGYQERVLLVLNDASGGQAAATSPGLNGTWLVIREQEMPGLVFLPVYLAASQLEKLADGRQSSESLRSELQARGIQWDQIVVLDHQALAGLESDHAFISSNSLVPSGPMAGVRQQMAFMEQVCSHLAKILPGSSSVAAEDVFCEFPSLQPTFSQIK
jgi:hypothetical protein